MIDESILNKYYGKIANKLDEMIPIEWHKISLFAEIGTGWSSTAFYFLTNNNTYHWSDIFEKLSINEDIVDMRLYELNKIIEELWEEFNKVNLDSWNAITFDLESNGRFKVNFNYDEPNREMSRFEKEDIWAYRKLGIIPKSKFQKKLLKEFLEIQGEKIPEELKNV